MKPRDPKRIHRITELLLEAWQLVPDFRLTQLIIVVSGKPEDSPALWHVEDDSMENKLQAFIKERQRFKNKLG
jgi:hypothetical protein